MTAPLSVGLVGAGPWATMVHAPTLTAGTETQLAGVWARRPEAAEALANQHHTRAFTSIEALFDACDAVAFAVPPDVQATIAVDAAKAGKALLLEKPIAADLAGAERLADAAGSAGVVSAVVLTWRYAEPVRSFLVDAAEFEAVGGRGRFISGAFLGGPFATPWRLERGPLLDLGPHLVDLLDATLGEVVGVRAHRSPGGWVGLLLEHESGVVSEASLCARSAAPRIDAGVELHGAGGVLAIDCSRAIGREAFATMRRLFAGAVTGRREHPLDVQHGLRLQRVLHDAEASW